MHIYIYVLFIYIYIYVLFIYIYILNSNGHEGNLTVSPLVLSNFAKASFFPHRRHLKSTDYPYQITQSKGSIRSILFNS